MTKTGNTGVQQEIIIALRPLAKEGARLSFVSQLNQSSRSRNENGSCDEGQSQCHICS